jgi:hypothetical protein
VTVLVCTDIIRAPERVAETTAARSAMRSQISRLERALGSLAFELGMAGRALPLPTVALTATGPVAAGSPRLLSLGELEAVRDQLVADVSAAQRALVERSRSETRARRALESMLADPASHRFEILERAELGEPGCGAYEVRPRLGLLGMLFGWWCVKLSSGCP